MEALIAQAGAFIQTHQVWAGPIVCLLTFGESMLIIGMLLPATAVLLMAGGLVGNGTLDATPILLWGFLGAIAGDMLSFWIGKWLGPGVLRWRLLKRHRTDVARARLFFYRYGFFAVLIGRFLGPIRSTIPTIAGIMGMPQGRFQFANVLSALAWVPGLLAPGFLAARSLDTTQHSGQSMLYAALLFSIIVGVALFMLFSRKRKPARRRRKNLPHHTDSSDHT